MMMMIALTFGGVNAQLHLQRLAPEFAGDDDTGARCLDGTLPAFYFERAEKFWFKKKWVIFLGDGRPCLSGQDCYQRAVDEVTGGSSFYPDELPALGPNDTVRLPQSGLLSNDCEVNPHFCKYNKVFIPQCSSTVFLGQRPGKLLINGGASPDLFPINCSALPAGVRPPRQCRVCTPDNPTPPPGCANDFIYLRGRTNLEAILSQLLDGTATDGEKYRLKRAKIALLSGGSGGGIAAGYHGEWIKSLLPRVIKFRIAPVSGFLPTTIPELPGNPVELLLRSQSPDGQIRVGGAIVNDVTGASLIKNAVQNIWGAVESLKETRCVKRLGANATDEEKLTCIDVANVLKASPIPFFMMQSAFDFFYFSFQAGALSTTIVAPGETPVPVTPPYNFLDAAGNPQGPGIPCVPDALVEVPLYSPLPPNLPAVTNLPPDLVDRQYGGCFTGQVAGIQDLGNQIMRVLDETAGWRDGYFLHECATHEAPFFDDSVFTDVKIRGVSMSKALRRWFFGFSYNKYRPCTLNASNAKSVAEFANDTISLREVQCNPTCFATNRFLNNQ